MKFFKNEVLNIVFYRLFLILAFSMYFSLFGYFQQLLAARDLHFEGAEFLNCLHTLALLSFLWILGFLFKFLLTFVYHIFFSQRPRQQAASLLSTTTSAGPPALSQQQRSILLIPNAQWFSSNIFYVHLDDVSYTNTCLHHNAHLTLDHNQLVLHANPWTFLGYFHIMPFSFFVVSYSICSVFPLSFFTVMAVWTFLTSIVFNKKIEFEKYLIASSCIPFQSLGYLCLCTSIVLATVHSFVTNQVLFQQDSDTPMHQFDSVFVILLLFLAPCICSLCFIKMSVDLRRLSIDMQTLFSFLLPSVTGLCVFYLFHYLYVVGILTFLNHNNVAAWEEDQQGVVVGDQGWVFNVCFFLLLPLWFLSFHMFVLKTFLTNDPFQINCFLASLVFGFLGKHYLEASEKTFFLHACLAFSILTFLFQSWVDYKHVLFKEMELSSSDADIGIDQSLESTQSLDSAQGDSCEN